MADKTWVGTTDGDWNTSTNWSPTIVPIAGENVFITSGSVPIDDYDNSAVALGIVTIGSGYTGANIGTKAGTGLILSCAVGKRISITGAPLLTTQNFWIDYNSANSTNIDLSGFGTVTPATMVDFGVHLSRTAGTVSVTNNGGALSLDSGTFNSMIDAGTKARTVANTGASINNYDMVASGAQATLNMIPTTIDVSLGIVTVEGSGTIINVSMWGGQVFWNGGGAISTLLTVRGGTFDTSQATAQVLIADAVVFGDSLSTKVDLTLASVTNDIKHHGTPVIVYPASSDGTLT